MPYPNPARVVAAGAATAGAVMLMGWLTWQDISQSGCSVHIEGTQRFADTRSVSEISLKSNHPLGRWLDERFAIASDDYEVQFDEEARTRLGVKIWPTERGAWLVRAGAHAGTLPVLWYPKSEGERQPAGQAAIEFRVPDADRDADGIPDVVEWLTDDERAGFTSWFTAIAEAQATRIDDRWARIHQDCAGLVRFAFREAIRTHDDAWLSQWRYLPGTPVSFDAMHAYPNLPIVEDTPFRAIGGPYDPTRSRQEQFSAAPNARTLWQHNTHFVSKDVAHARAGDLLFFHVPDANGSRLHTMIALGDAPAATHHARATRVVYHTGLAPPDGEVRLVRLKDLARHPDPSWHPEASNPRFIGVHRLSHLVFETQTRPQLALDSRNRSRP